MVRNEVNADEVVIYQDAAGVCQMNVRLQGETVWLTQKQMAEIFDKNVRTVNEHIKNIFKEQELEESSVIRNFRITAQDGKTYETAHYNLDVIISVGYRVKSVRGTQFRIWATQTLKEHLIKGYTINTARLTERKVEAEKELKAALELVRQTASATELTVGEGKGLIDVITRYTKTYLLLQRYDEGVLEAPQGHKPHIILSLAEARSEIERLRTDLFRRQQATSLFGHERGHSLESIVNNLEQTIMGEPAYPSIESKAAHLLYFIIKDHPFTDGNKRIGAHLFLHFLNRNIYLLNKEGLPKIDDMGLTALALLIAESDPKAKDVVIRLIMNMLSEEIK